MDWDGVGRLTVAVGGVAVVIIKYVFDHRAQGGRWRRIRQHVDLLGLLPAESAAQKQLQSHVELMISRLILDEAQKKRDPSGIALSAILLALAGYLAWFSLSQGGNGIWLGLAVPVGILGLFGLSESISRRVRDDRGQVIREPKSSSRGGS